MMVAMDANTTLSFHSNLKNWRNLYGQESFGGSGAFGIRIHVAGTLPDDLDDIKEVRYACYEAIEKLTFAIRSAYMAKNPKALEERAAQRAEIIGCFGPEALFVEEIPNGYCKDWCCTQLPWFIVTTPVGRIKIGWRKRVINIEWGETINTKKAEELFPDEDVTKEGKLIHAWSADDAARYLSAIIASGSGAPTLPAPAPVKRLK